MTAILTTAGIPALIEGGDAYQLAAYGAAGDDPVGADQIIGAMIGRYRRRVADLGDGRILAQFLDSRIAETLDTRPRADIRRSAMGADGRSGQ